MERNSTNPEYAQVAPSFWMTGASLGWFLLVSLATKSEEIGLLISLPVVIVGSLFGHVQLGLTHIFDNKLAFFISCLLLVVLLYWVGKYSVKMREPILVRSIGTVIMFCVSSLCAWMCFSFDLTILHPGQSDGQLIFKISEFLVVGQLFSVVFCLIVDVWKCKQDFLVARQQ